MPGMCEICDGMSREESLSAMHETVQRNGWSITAVSPSRSNPTWAYTVGLAGGFGHPELVVVGLPAEQAAVGLNELGARVADGETFDPWSTADVLGVGVRFGDVHPAHFDLGTFDRWIEYHDWLVHPWPAARALQLVLPDDMRCPDCLFLNRCLAEPTPIGPDLVPACTQPAMPRPNRAERRRRPARGSSRPTPGPIRRRPLAG
jgi:hypothetical protein